MRRSILPFLVLAFGFTASAQAQEGLASTFDQVDTDNDGTITKAEFIAYHSLRFDEIVEELDADGDQTIAISELNAASSPRISSLRPPIFSNNAEEAPAVKLRKRAPAGAGGPTGPTSRRYKVER